MKTKLLILALGLFMVLPLSSFASSSLVDRLSGRILLQVEDNGEAWYVEPTTKERSFLGRPDDAFRIMRELGLGISEKDFNSFKGKAPQRLSGKILLRVDANGEAYYVNPIDLKLHFLGRPTDAFSVMRNLGLGIKNTDLEQIKTRELVLNKKEDNFKEIENENIDKIITPTEQVVTPPRAPNQDWLDEMAKFEKYYPIIISMTDNKGNVNTASTFNTTRVEGDSQNKNTLTSLKAGDNIILTINATEPLNRPLLYAWAGNINCPGMFTLSESPQDSYYTTKNSISCILSEDDIENTLPLGIIRIEGYIKSEKIGYRNPSNFDDSISMSYNDLPYQPFLP